MLVVSRPMTATSSISQSTLPPAGITTSVSGPVKLEEYLVNTGGKWVGGFETGFGGVRVVVQPDREHLPGSR